MPAVFFRPCLLRGRKNLNAVPSFGYYTVQPSCYVYNSVNNSVYVWLPTCEIFNPRKKPPHPPAPMNIRRKKLTKERIAQKHASILAANAIPTIFVENQSNSLKATYLLHLV